MDYISPTELSGCTYSTTTWNPNSPDSVLWCTWLVLVHFLSVCLWLLLHFFWTTC